MDEDLERLLRDSAAAFKAMSPEDQASMIEAQRQSWARAFVEFGDDEAEARWIRENMPDLEPSPSLPHSWA